MKSTHFQHVADDGRALQVWAWQPDDAVRAALLVVHGMAEHGERYQRLAGALSKSGIAVYAVDQRGHGRTAVDESDRGCLGPHGGWRRMIEDIAELNLRLKDEHEGLPLFMLGHSMGSFLLQQYVSERGDHIDGAILSATDDDPGLLRLVALALLTAEARLLGRDHPSALAERLSFGEFNKPFEPARTPFDWLSRDETEVDAYISDPLCGFRVSAGLWVELLHALGTVAREETRQRVPESLPLLLIAGSRDPVAKFGRGPEALAAAYEAAGVRDVSLEIFEDGRHELLNDLCRDEVTAALQAWLQRRMPG